MIITNLQSRIQTFEKQSMKKDSRASGACAIMSDLLWAPFETYCKKFRCVEVLCDNASYGLVDQWCSEITGQAFAREGQLDNRLRDTEDKTRVFVPSKTRVAFTERN